MSKPISVVIGHRTKRATGWAAFLVFVAASLALSWNFHQAANAAPVTAIWQQPTVTVDDREVAALAQSWQAPFEVVYAAQGADITVGAQSHDDMVGGEATRSMDGDRITGCAITVENPADVVMLHELGHCWGVSHSNDDQHSLMYWIQGGNSGASGVTQTDRKALARLYQK